MKTYIGKICSKHPEKAGERRINNRACVECHKEHSAKHRRVHAERVREKTAEWAKNNRDKVNAIHATYRTKNPEKVKQRAVAWYAANKVDVKKRAKQWAEENLESVKKSAQTWRVGHPGIVNAKHAQRRATKLRATPAWANKFFIEEAYHLAKLREKMCGGKWHVDHIVPLKSKLVCGLHVEYNLCVIPGKDNMKKGNRYWPDMPV